MLGRLCDEHRTPLWHFTPVPVRHPYRPAGVDVATFRRELVDAGPAGYDDDQPAWLIQ